MNERLDRRKKYTRMVLKDSLIALLKNKQISSITVKEICEHADINRSTFYTHYRDHFDLLEQIEEEIITDLNAYLSQYNFAKEEEALQMTEKLLEYIASKYDICHTLLNENGDHSFERRVMDVARTFLIKSWMDNNEVDPDTSEYASTFAISGSIYVIKHWLANNMDQPPKQIARLINSFRLRE
ncbi:AcrR family transcriptional regulator [Virgibacillus natechei]|uniref:AcrR family transcriptional regulator n=1 Tax=Virgibacillus natechei TaxID=1216297 RepID=A0ABS4IJM3_9BACI|nr:TetR/AcrR family transcriptional regulator C-terminal domain-containing protein [Virgibacillus natechei]MBP1971162.1 AcrR family transcriptional regulator [Virgibacillus natechei]UZD11909.1 TetR/AcrR family transcriptional regulator C-terminal domain-containing protein [Virgibacillus natechei]